MPKKWKLKSADVPQAFMRREKDANMRKIQINAPKEAGLKDGEVWTFTKIGDYPGFVAELIILIY